MRSIHRPHLPKQILSEGPSNSKNTKRAASLEYQSWAAMWTRCTNPTRNTWKDYGGRGIVICERWRQFKFFLDDMGRRPSREYSIDRINPNGNYEPSNCRWATPVDQQKTQRQQHFIEIDGTSLLPSEWSKISGICPNRIVKRIAAGWIPRLAVFDSISHCQNGKTTLDGRKIRDAEIAHHLALSSSSYSRLMAGKQYVQREMRARLRAR